VKDALLFVLCVPFVTGCRVTPRPRSTPAASLALKWNYADRTDILFNIYSHTNAGAPAPWPLYATTPDTNFQFSVSDPSRFFYVTASNTVTKLESR